MQPLPRSGHTLLVRTAFTDEPAWHRLRTTVTTPNEDDFLADLEIIDDPAYRDLTPTQLRALVPTDDYLLIVADTTSLTGADQPVLALFRQDGHEAELRVVASKLWSIENNLSIANMDWDEFAEATGDDGVFRGF